MQWHFFLKVTGKWCKVYAMKKQRLQIMVPPYLHSWLKRESKRRVVSIAEIIRRMLEREHERISHHRERP